MKTKTFTLLLTGTALIIYALVIMSVSYFSFPIFLLTTGILIISGTLLTRYIANREWIKDE